MSDDTQFVWMATAVPMIAFISYEIGTSYGKRKAHGAWRVYLDAHARWPLMRSASGRYAMTGSEPGLLTAWAMGIVDRADLAAEIRKLKLKIEEMWSDYEYAETDGWNAAIEAAARKVEELGK